MTHSAQMRKFLTQVRSNRPSSFRRPWNIVIYSDEVTPGDPVKPRNDRKFQTVYWSFMEFGNTALSHEEAWFCMMTEYSHVINEVQAGMSQVFAQIINPFDKSRNSFFNSICIGIFTIRWCCLHTF